MHFVRFALQFSVSLFDFTLSLDLSLCPGDVCHGLIVVTSPHKSFTRLCDICGTHIKRNKSDFPDFFAGHGNHLHPHVTGCITSLTALSFHRAECSCCFMFSM